MKELPPRLAGLLYGYRASRILLSAVELDLFSALKGGATAEKAARRIRAPHRGVDILLHALAALGLVRKVGGKFVNTKDTREFLAAGGGRDWRLGLGHHTGLWRSWSELTDVVKKGRPQLPRESSKRARKETQAFIGLMHQHGVVRAPRVAEALRLGGVQNVLDLGGGSGAYSVALARRKHGLRITLLDQPAVIPLAEKYVTAAGFRAGFTFRSGDMTRADFGQGFDLVLLSSICHSFSPRRNQALLQKAYRALCSGGQLAIHDFILNRRRTGPMHAALFAVNMLVNTEGGNSYSADEYRDWLRAAGFRKIVFRRLEAPSDLIVAEK